MGVRREARELALQALYQLDMSGDEDPARSLALFWSHFRGMSFRQTTSPDVPFASLKSVPVTAR